MFKDDDQDRTGRRRKQRETPYELICRLAKLTAFTDPDVVLAIYREERLNQGLKNGKTHASRLFGCHVRSVYKFLDGNISDAIKNVNHDYREVLLSGFRPGKPFKFFEARRYLTSKDISLSDERLRGLLNQCEFEGLLEIKGKNHQKALYTVNNEPIEGDYSQARLHALLVVTSNDFREVKIKFKLGPAGLAAVHGWLDSKKREEYPIYDIIYGLDKESEGGENLVRIGVATVLYADKACALADHQNSRLTMALNDYEETPATFIRPTRGDFTPANAKKLSRQIKALKLKFAELAAAAMLMDTQGHQDYILSIGQGTLSRKTGRAN